MRFVLGAVSGLLILIAALLLVNSRNAIQRLLFDEAFLLLICALITLAVLCLAAAGIIDRLIALERRSAQLNAILEDLIRRRARRAQPGANVPQYQPPQYVTYDPYAPKIARSIPNAFGPNGRLASSAPQADDTQPIRPQRDPLPDRRRLIIRR